jgi:hypothetical protein
MSEITYETRAASEDARARDAIERMTDRIMVSPAPGVTRDDARAFVREIALRNDEVRPLNALGNGGRLTRSQAKALVIDQLEIATLKQPRVQAAIGRFSRLVHAAYPGMDAAQLYAYSSRRFLDAFMAHPRMAELAASLYVALVRLKVKRADGVRAFREILNPEHLANAVEGANASPSVQVDVPVAFDLHPCADVPAP